MLLLAAVAAVLLAAELTAAERFSQRFFPMEAAKKTSVNVVVSRHNEDISWIAGHCLHAHNVTYHIYNKGAPLGASDLAMCRRRVVEHRVANIGLEAGSILEHILREYDGGGLADVTFFKQGDAPSVGYAGYRKGGGHLWYGVRPVLILQSTFLDWAPCFSQLRPGCSFPRIALPFHDRCTRAWTTSRPSTGGT